MPDQGTRRLQADWNNWNRFSTTSYKKSPYRKGCVLAVLVVPPAEARVDPVDKIA
jgi:hypothetical protein